MVERNIPAHWVHIEGGPHSCNLSTNPTQGAGKLQFVSIIFSSCISYKIRTLNKIDRVIQFGTTFCMFVF